MRGKATRIVATSSCGARRNSRLAACVMVMYRTVLRFARSRCHFSATTPSFRSASSAPTSSTPQKSPRLNCAWPCLRCQLRTIGSGKPCSCSCLRPVRLTLCRNFVVVMVTPVAISSIGWRYYIVYATIAACIVCTSRHCQLLDAASLALS